MSSSKGKDADRVEVLNFTSPGNVTRVNAPRYKAVREVYLAILPDALPGLTPAQILSAVAPRLPQDLFPGGDKAGWWCKCVQLDLEARGVIKRAETPPVRLIRV